MLICHAVQVAVVVSQVFLFEKLFNRAGDGERNPIHLFWLAAPLGVFYLWEYLQEPVTRFLRNPGERLVNYYELLLVTGGGILSASGGLVFVARGDILYVLGVALSLLMMLLLFQYCSKVNITLSDIRRELVRMEEYLCSLLFDRETAMERKLFASAVFLQGKAEKEMKLASGNLCKGLVKKDIVNLLYQFSDYLFAISAYLIL